MWTNSAMWLCGILSFIGGAFVIATVIMAGCTSDDLTTEKRGVWFIKDRAYKLTPIPK